MKGKRAPFLLITVLGILFFAAGCKTIEGRVAVKGSEPYTYVVIETNGDSYKITGDYEEVLYKDYQNKYIKVKGRLVKEADGHINPGEFEIKRILKTTR